MSQASTNISKAYKRQYCEYQGSQKYNLERHINGKHSGTVFKCKICLKEYILFSNLHEHEKAMNSGTMFKCKIGSRVYKWQRNLHRHEKGMHNGEIGLLTKAYI